MRLPIDLVALPSYRLRQRKEYSQNLTSRVLNILLGISRMNFDLVGIPDKKAILAVQASHRGA